MKPADRIIAKRYTRAYMGLDGLAFNHALEGAAREKIAALKKIFLSVEPHKKNLVHPAVSGAVKKEILEKIAGPAAAHGAAGGFLGFLVAENRFSLFEEIMASAIKLFEDWSGIKKAEISVRYPLEDAELARLEKALAKAGGRKVRLSQTVDERVLSGFEIKMGDLVIDATLEGRFERLKKELCAG